MSLTGHLSNPGSPIRRFFAAEYPNWAGLRFQNAGVPSSTIHFAGKDLELETLTMLTNRATAVLPRHEEGYGWAAAGGAFDYRLRYEFEVGKPTAFAAAKGWESLVRRAKGVRVSDSGWDELLAALEVLTTRANPTRGDLADEDELELARMCGLLALYEQLYRMGGVFNPATGLTPLAQAGLNQPLASLLDLVDPDLPADVIAMIREFRTAAPELAAAREVYGDPHFDRSPDLRGAEGDLVVDHLLLEVKTTKHAKLSARFAWQLLGYLLADSSDSYGITSLGWYFARHGLLWTFPVDEFLRVLAGRDVELSHARAEFAELCSTLRGPSRRGPGVEVLLAFHPPTSGGGRWHAAAADVPWVADSLTVADTPQAPVCGTRTSLDLDLDPFYPAVGERLAAVDQRCCRRCLRYTEASYLRELASHTTARLADLSYFPPARGTGKWHARLGDTGWRFVGLAESPACGTQVELDESIKALRPPSSGDVSDADVRLCRRCLTVPPHGSTSLP